MSAEPEFLLACVRRFLHPHGPLPGSARLDWDALARLAAKHAVVPLLYLAAREAAALYGNLALRSSSDLDLLIRPRDLVRVRHLLPSLGFRLSSTLHWPCESACFRARAPAQLC